MTAAPAPFCAVRVEGEDLTDLAVRVQVEEGDRRADSARLLFGDSMLVLCDVLREGLGVEVELGREDEHAIVFRGVATSVTTAVPQVGSPTLEVVAHDRLILLSMEPRTRRWANTSVSAIVRSVALEHGLVPGRIEPGEDAAFPVDRPAQQVAETDLAFLQRLAADHDAALYVDHAGPVDQLCLVSTAALEAAEPIEQSLVFNATLAEFRASFDAWAADPSERLVTTELSDGERVVVERDLLLPEDSTWEPDAARLARLGAGADRVGRLATRSAATRDRITDFWRRPPAVAGAPARPRGTESGSHGDRRRRRGQTCSGRAGGSIWLRPRARVRIEGYGGRFSGVWTLARVRHDVELALRRYTTSFTCVR
jgi:phage protein D